LHAELCPNSEMTRDDFEEVLGALARAGFLRILSAVFEKDGRSIPYRKASLTASGDSLEPGEPPEFQMKLTVQSLARKRKGKGKKKAAPKKTARKTAKPQPSGLAEALRAWRLAEAKRRGVPAFRICTDATLNAIADQRPETAAELLAIPGIGMKMVETYGAAIFRLISSAR